MTTQLEKLLGSPPVAYRKLAEKLEKAGWMSQGTVVSRTLRRQVKGKWVENGPYYMWTCKSGGKTVCHALTLEQYHAAREAIQANSAVMKAITEMQSMTIKTILEKIPGVKKRK